MNDHVCIEAPAKLNLHLGIGALRPDGFHDIASIFQAISLSDTVRVTLSGDPGIELRCACDCPPEMNTMYRAAKAFVGALNGAGDASTGLIIEADKRIPAGAGLGGGSSDAAAVLRALAALFPGAVSWERLLALASSIGSDVPFFMGSACAIVRGRGESLEDLAPRSDFALVLVTPPLHVATAAAYAELDAYRRLSATAYGPGMLEADLNKAVGEYRRSPPGAWTFQNDFFPALSSRYPVLKESLDALNAQDADFAAMTGSGSVVFGVFSDVGSAEKARSELIRQGHDAIAAFPLARLPDSV